MVSFNQFWAAFAPILAISSDFGRFRHFSTARNSPPKLSPATAKPGMPAASYVISG